MTRLKPVHPGEILVEEFLEPLGISQYRLAKETCVPPRRINEIVLEKRGITADTALRLAKFFGTSELFWLNLQARHDLDVQREKLGAALVAVRPFSSEPVAPARVNMVRSMTSGTGKRKTAARRVEKSSRDK